MYYVYLRKEDCKRELNISREGLWGVIYECFYGRGVLESKNKSGEECVCFCVWYL